MEAEPMEVEEGTGDAPADRFEPELHFRSYTPKVCAVRGGERPAGVDSRVQGHAVARAAAAGPGGA